MTSYRADVVRRSAPGRLVRSVESAHAAGREPRPPVESYMFANTGSDDVPDLGAGDALGLTGRE